MLLLMPSLWRLLKILLQDSVLEIVTVTNSLAKTVVLTMTVINIASLLIYWIAQSFAKKDFSSRLVENHFIVLNFSYFEMVPGLSLQMILWTLVCV